MVVRGSGGMFHQKNLHALRSLLVTSETAFLGHTNCSLQGRLTPTPKPSVGHLKNYYTRHDQPISHTVLFDLARLNPRHLDMH